MQQLIPARIIQTGKTRTLTLKQQAMVQNVRLLNPSYEYCFFDNADVDSFIARECPEDRATFDSFEFSIQRYDFFRYLAVYRLGGFYFDLDVMLAKDLEPLRQHSCVFPFEGLTFSTMLRRKGMDWEIGNYAFGAVPGHSFLKAMIDSCVRAQRDERWAEELMRGVPRLSRPDYRVLTTTGPSQLTRTLVENPSLAESVHVLFPTDVCEPHTWNVFGDFGVHVMEGSWRTSKSIVRRKIAAKLEARRLDRLLEESRRLGKTRQVPRGGCDLKS